MPFIKKAFISVKILSLIFLVYLFLYREPAKAPYEEIDLNHQWSQLKGDVDIKREGRAEH